MDMHRDYYQKETLLDAILKDGGYFVKDTPSGSIYMLSVFSTGRASVSQIDAMELIEELDMQQEERYAGWDGDVRPTGEIRWVYISEGR